MYLANDIAYLLNEELFGHLLRNQLDENYTLKFETFRQYTGNLARLNVEMATWKEIISVKPLSTIRENGYNIPFKT